MNTSEEQLSLRFRLDLPNGRPDGDAKLEPDLMCALAAKGAGILESGVCEYDPWCAKLLANFGEGIAHKVQGHLPELYRASHEELRKRQGGVQSPKQGCAGTAASAPQTSGDSRSSGRPRPGWRRLRLAVGLTAASAAVFCLAAVWVWQHQEPLQAAAKNAAPDTIAANASAKHPLPDSGKLKESVPDEVEALKARAQKGDAEAQYGLGERYSKGNGVPLDQEKAVASYRKAAEQGLAKAQAALAACYFKGEGVAKDFDQAVAWFRKAAEQGDAKGQNGLGVSFTKGQGVAQDYTEAVKWFRKAAEQGYAAAQNNVGVSFAQGHGLPQDYAEAFEWWRKAAAQGYTNAQYNLGLCYAKGQGVSQDYAEAVKWFRKAAEQGYAGGQNILGASYASGRGVRQDYAEAVKWFRKAAEQGNAAAQNHLGLSYEKGQGVCLDFAEAIEWYTKALEQGYDPAKNNLARAKAEQAYARPSNDPTRRASRPLTPPATPRISEQPYAAEAQSIVGTGFFVTDDGYFVTCEHVVRGASSFHVRSPSGSLSARLIKKDRSIDVAVLKVDGAFRALPVVAQPRVKLGEAVFTVGFPNPVVQGVEPKLTRGEISSMAGIQDNPRYYQISVPVQPGNSGGALLDECGNVVGVVTSRLDDVATYQESGALPQNVNYAVKGGLVYNFLCRVPELSGKLKAPRTTKDREAASGVAERAAVLVIAE